MERGLDLSRQNLASLAQISRDVVRHVERDAEPYALSLAQNRLTELHDLDVFAHVVQLDLSGNQLRSLDGIHVLTQLESLNASRNSLSSIDALASLAHLRVLHVAENHLTQIDVLRSLKTLVAVDASFNSITTWPQLSQSTKIESIDLSSNQLEAFPVSAAVRLFPPNLRRLSLAKNEIQHLCGIAALGMFLQRLQTIQVESNPATQRILRDGGCLDFLWVNLFASVAFAKGDGVRRDDFVVPVDIVDAVEDAVERGDEAVLTHFLLTGTVTPTVYRPPPPSQPVTASHGNDRDKLHELSQPLRTESPIAPVTNASDGLSKESKMEMWKRILDERKTQELRARGPMTAKDIALTMPPPLPPTPTPIPPPQATMTVPPPPPILPPKATAVARTEAKPRVAPLPSPSCTTVLSRHEKPIPIGSVSSSSIEALATQVKTLNDQLTGMRKYVNVWIKREQLTRVAAAKRIQKCIRHRLWQRHLTALLHRRRVWRHQEYSVEPCSSTRASISTISIPANQRHLHLCAVVLQRVVRGWLVRNRVCRWLYYSDAAIRIQRPWRRHRGVWVAMKRELGLLSAPAAVANVVTALACDVRQLQRVFVVQEHVLARQWRELADYKRIVEATWTPAVAKVQRLWRGYVVRRTLQLSPRPQRTRVMEKDTNSQRDAEIAALRTELDALKQVVQRLMENN